MADFRHRFQQVTLASVPRPQPSIGEQLGHLLEEKNLSARELGRRMAEAEDGPKATFQQRWDSRVRWLQKVKSPTEKRGVEIPSRQRLDAIEAAADAPCYFKVPDRERRAAKATREETIDRRLSALEEQSVRVDDLAPLLRVLRLLASGKRSEALRALSEVVDQ